MVTEPEILVWWGMNSLLRYRPISEKLLSPLSDAVFLGSQRLWRHVSGVVLRSLWESSSVCRSHWLGEIRWLVRIGTGAYLGICRSGPQLEFRNVCRLKTSKTLEEGRGTKGHAPGSAKTVTHFLSYNIVLYVSINYRGECQFLKLYNLVESLCQDLFYEWEGDANNHWFIGEGRGWDVKIFWGIRKF